MTKTRKSVLALGLCLVIGLTGCTSSPKLTGVDLQSIKQVDDGVLHFSDDFAKVERLNGQKVKMTGYMSLMSPLDGSYVYLMNLPLQTCPFCLPNTTQITNTVACYAPEGTALGFTTSPVVVEGTIEVGEISDDLGYTYAFRLKDVSYTMADSDTMAENYAVYSAVAENNLLWTIYSLMDTITATAMYADYGFTYDDAMASRVDNSVIDGCTKDLKALGADTYGDLIGVCEKLKEFNTVVLACLEGNDMSAVYETANMALLDGIWGTFNAWISKYEI